MLNPFFTQGSQGEQSLVQDLINEQLRMYGVDVYYLPRIFATEKTVLKEVIESKFTSAYPIEAYVETYDGYDGLGTLLSKFGIQDIDNLTITISRERYENYIQPLIEQKDDIKLSSRPKEGDLIYFPLGDRIFEIKYVEHEKPFYQLQKNYVYQLTCELFRYEDEIIDTDFHEIDDNIQDEGYTQLLTMVSVASTATATASIVNGGVKTITLTNRGSGYRTAPTVLLSKAPTGGSNAEAKASLLSGIVDCNGVESDRVQSVSIINSGYGYTVAPKVSFESLYGSGAEAETTIGDGVIRVITLTDGGGGYSSPPNITFSGISSVSAAATAVVSAAGTIQSIHITNAGLGYTEAPIITISSPQLGISTGSYVFNEKVTGTLSGTTAKVRNWNSVTGVLEVANISGQFKKGDILLGEESSAGLLLVSVNLDTTDPFADNIDIETEADAILDFTEKNPFGSP